MGVTSKIESVGHQYWNETWEVRAAHCPRDYKLSRLSSSMAYFCRPFMRGRQAALATRTSSLNLCRNIYIISWPIHNCVREANTYNVRFCTRSALEMLLELYRLVTNLFVSLDQSRMMINFKRGAPTEIHIPANKNSLSQIDSISGIELSNCVSRWANASCLRLTSVNPSCLRWRFFCISDAK